MQECDEANAKKVFARCLGIKSKILNNKLWNNPKPQNFGTKWDNCCRLISCGGYKNLEDIYSFATECPLQEVGGNRPHFGNIELYKKDPEGKKINKYDIGI
jgi:hypothetical protein